ncbi:MAG: hypothetical protein JXA54_14885 [Candidatus Heimdallarchaeota archaeon]|nr:hypothetical protein [Candidatus Heimdallarchaeota archaeon]
MRKRCFSNGIFILSLFITILAFQHTSDINTIGFGANFDDAVLLTQGTTNRRTSLTLNLDFIGFSQELINETAINADLVSVFKHSYTEPLPWIDFTFDYNYITENSRLDLEDYIQTIAVNGTGTGYDINVTQLKIDLATGIRSDIFIPKDGMSIDADLVTEYLYENLYEEPTSGPGYTFYIMNFSNFDSPDHSLEHWYDTCGTDLDGNTSISWWYSGYRNLEKRAAIGWGGKYRFCYLDLSSRSWYLDFVSNAWLALGGSGSQLFYKYPDLDNFTQTFDPRTTLGQEKLTTYLSEWINSYLGNVFSGPVFSNLPYGQSVSLQVIVLNNLTINGFPEESLKWCISKYRIQNQLENDFPWVNWLIDIDWFELMDYPDIFDYIQNNVLESSTGRFVPVEQGLFTLLQNRLSQTFDLNAAEVVLPCYFFLTDEISFSWYGTSFAGLGGMGWEILLGTQNSIFDNTTTLEPRRGMSTVMIHELGHSLGLPHPHTDVFGWGSSFIEDVMSYFSTTSQFSSFYKDAIGRAHTDANYEVALDELLIMLGLYNETFNPEDKPQLLEDTITQIYSNLELIPIYYNDMDYNASSSIAFETRNLIAFVVNNIVNQTSTSKFSGFNMISILIILPLFASFKKLKGYNRKY